MGPMVWKMVVQVGWKLAMLAVNVVPVERIAAAAVNALIRKIDTGKVEKVEAAMERLALLSRHCLEISDLTLHMLEDRQTSPEEMGVMRATMKRMRDDVMKAWADGAPAKPQQKELGAAGVKGSYTIAHDAME